MKQILETLKDKWTEYLIESIVIVASILGAYALDNWNEEQNNRKKEVNILVNILTDLQKDKTELTEITARRTDKAKSADIMTNYYNGIELANLADYYFHWTNVLYWEAHYPRNIAFKELVNSANVSIIKNPTIRNLLLEINASYEELFAVREHMYDDYSIYLYKPYSNIIDYEEGIEVWSNPNSSIELSEDNVKVALKNKAIKNGFTLASFNNIILRDQLIEIHKKVDLTSSAITKELAK